MHVPHPPPCRRMDVRIKDTRHLLLLFPDEVARSLPALSSVGGDISK